MGIEILYADAAAFSRASIIQLIEASNLTGRLVVVDGAVEIGHVAFVRGFPVAATCGTRGGLDALLDLLVLRCTRIRFLADATVTGSPIGDPLSIVVEGARLNDEYRQLADTVHQYDGNTLPLEVSRDVVAVLTLLDGTRDVARAIADAGVSPSAVIDDLRDLVSLGTLRPAIEAPARPAPALGYDDALRQGRAAFERGDLREAERSFQVALELRPGDLVASQNLNRVRQVGAVRGDVGGGREPSVAVRD